MFANAGYRLETYREHIEKIFLQEPDLYAFRPVAPNHPRIATFVYANVPGPGYTTSLTYGLSEYDNPAWVGGRPELILSVASAHENWGSAPGLAAARFQLDADFAYGDILDFEQPISDDSAMQAFVLFAPAILDRADSQAIKLDYYNVNLVGMYPIYKEEIATINAIGLERFMHHPDYDMYSVKRKAIHMK